MQSKSTNFILVVIIALLTISLVALSCYILIEKYYGNESSPANTRFASNTVPKDSELSTINLYENKKYFNLKNDNPNRISVLQVGVSLQYFNEIKDNKKIDVLGKINNNLPEIKELISTYFLNVTLEQVKDPSEIQKIKDELKIKINDLLNHNERSRYEYVYKVIFDDWLFQ